MSRFNKSPKHAKQRAKKAPAADAAKSSADNNVSDVIEDGNDLANTNEEETENV